MTQKARPWSVPDEYEARDLFPDEVEEEEGIEKEGLSLSLVERGPKFRGE